MLTLYTDTPFSRAIVALFTELQAGIDLEYPALAAGQVKVYMFGGAAVHLYTQTHQISKDVDVEFNTHLRIDTDIVVAYRDADDIPRTLVLDTRFQPTLGLLHPDYRQDAVEFLHVPDASLWSYLASPVDLALSKLVRFHAGDQQDLAQLAQQRLFTLQAFTRRVEEALPYFVGHTQMLTYNIRDAQALISDVTKEQ